jgi:RNA chaperone Hfq
MDHNAERNLQISEGRDRERGTLHARPGHPKRQFDAKRDTGTRPVVKFAKGHDAVLKRMQDNNSLVFIQPLNGDGFEGRVKNRDRYTITLEVGGRERVIYKHAIEYFEAVAGESDVVA